MTDEEAKLIEPTAALRDGYLAYLAEFAGGHVHGAGPRMADGETSAQFVRRLADYAGGAGRADVP